MNFRTLFSSSSSSQAVVVGASGAVQAQTTSLPRARAFVWLSGVFLVGAVLLSVVVTGSLLEDRATQWSAYFQLLEEKKTEQQNLDALVALQSQLETIETDQLLFEAVVPLDQHYEHIVSLIEQLVEDIRREAFVELPQLISWRPVSRSEVSNGDFQELGIYEYQFSFRGEYQALMALFERIRSQARLIDVRAVRNLKLGEDGLVSTDLALWSYHLHF